MHSLFVDEGVRWQRNWWMSLGAQCAKATANKHQRSTILFPITLIIVTHYRSTAAHNVPLSLLNTAPAHKIRRTNAVVSFLQKFIHLIGASAYDDDEFRRLRKDIRRYARVSRLRVHHRLLRHNHQRCDGGQSGTRLGAHDGRYIPAMRRRAALQLVPIRRLQLPVLHPRRRRH